MRLSFIALAAVGAALLSAAPAAAQPGVVRTQLDSAVSLMGNEGFRPQDDFVTGTLAAGEDEEFELELEGGKTYIIVGVCDNDCSDLDLRLFDPNGREVASDLLTDDNPVVNVTPRRTGTYTVRAIMTSCSSEPCRYGIGVYGR